MSKQKHKTLFKQRKRLFRFGRNKSGAAAIEFAIVAPIFLGLMFSTFEVGWFYFTNSTLDSATSKAARLVRTGQVQGWGTAEGVSNDDDRFAKLYDSVCNVVKVWGDCTDRMTFEVQTFPTFDALAADTTAPTCADAPAADISAIPFVPGAELEIVRVRICLIYNTINPAIGVNLSEGSSHQKHLISMLIFRNEPYEKNV